jgi:hypothetical protein
MDYFRRIFYGGIQDPPTDPSQSLPHPPPATQHKAPARPSAPTKQGPTVKFDTPLHPHHRSHQSHTHKKRRHTSKSSMPSDFNGPVCKDVLELMKKIQSIPSQHKTTFDAVSKDTLDVVTDADALHVWESGSDMDALLQLTQVIVKVRNLDKTRAAMAIIAEGKSGRDDYGRLVELVRYLTGTEGKTHLNGTVTAFDAIVVVRSVVDNDDSAAVKRINTSLERVLKMSDKKKLVWHHGPVLSLLLSWINTTTPALRARLTGITVTAALDVISGVAPSPLGKSNRPADFQRLEDYAKKLAIPVLFLDPGCSLIAWENLARYMYYWVYYIHTFLPSPLLSPHRDKALDDLVTFSFRIRGAAENRYGAAIVRKVQSELDAGTARRWARSCLAPQRHSARGLPVCPLQPHPGLQPPGVLTHPHLPSREEERWRCGVCEVLHRRPHGVQLRRQNPARLNAHTLPCPPPRTGANRRSCYGAHTRRHDGRAYFCDEGPQSAALQRQ